MGNFCFGDKALGFGRKDETAKTMASVRIRRLSWMAVKRKGKGDFRVYCGNPTRKAGSLRAKEAGSPINVCFEGSGSWGKSRERLEGFSQQRSIRC